jgi:hypothetical protein
LSELKQDEKS